MAFVICFGNQKGGAGKTTITALTANSLSQDLGFRILAIDADMQYSLSNIRKSILINNPKASFSYHLIQSTMNTVVSDLIKYRDDYDIILVDMPGMLSVNIGDNDYVEKFLKHCDLVIVPVQPSVIDIKSSTIFLHHLQNIKKDKQKKNYYFEYTVLINRYDNTNNSKYVKNILLESGYDVMDSYISDLVEYKDKIYSPLSILKQSVKSPKIKGEFSEFIDELEKLIEK